MVELTHLKSMLVKFGNLPQIGVNIKNISNPHLVMLRFQIRYFSGKKTFEKKTPNNIPALRIMGGLEIPEPCYTGPSPSVGGFMDSCQCKGLVSPLTQIKLLWHGQTLNEETFRHVFFQVS